MCRKGGGTNGCARGRHTCYEEGASLRLQPLSGAAFRNGFPHKVRGLRTGSYGSTQQGGAPHKADNERGTIFNNVQIRVDDSFALEMHIDTDEANAAQIKSGDTVRIVSC